MAQMPNKNSFVFWQQLKSLASPYFLPFSLLVLALTGSEIIVMRGEDGTGGSLADAAIVILALYAMAKNYRTQKLEEVIRYLNAKYKLSGDVADLSPVPGSTKTGLEPQKEDEGSAPETFLSDYESAVRNSRARLK